MPRGDKSAFTDKQKRSAVHIAEGYTARGLPEARAEAIAWASQDTGGGNQSGSGREVPDTQACAQAGGAAAAARSPANRSAAARKGAATRARNRSENTA